MILSLAAFISGILSKEQLDFKIGFVVFLAGCCLSLAALLLAIRLKCEICRKRASVVFRKSEAQ